MLSMKINNVINNMCFVPLTSVFQETKFKTDKFDVERNNQSYNINIIFFALRYPYDIYNVQKYWYNGYKGITFFVFRSIKTSKTIVWIFKQDF